jgi:hypothetical protein
VAKFLRSFKQHRLRARYVCPECGRVVYRMCYLDGPGERIRGRIQEYYCGCKALFEYWGFSSRYKATVPYAYGGRWMRRCEDCGKDTEHAAFRKGDVLMCLSCGRQRYLDDEQEADHRAEMDAMDVSVEYIWGPER